MVIIISVWPPYLTRNKSRIKGQKYASNVWSLVFNICSYSDSYQSSNRKFKFCLYMYVDGFNVLFQMCIFLKEFTYVQAYNKVMTNSYHRKELL